MERLWVNLSRYIKSRNLAYFKIDYEDDPEMIYFLNYCKEVSGMFKEIDKIFALFGYEESITSIEVWKFFEWYFKRSNGTRQIDKEWMEECLQLMKSHKKKKTVCESTRRFFKDSNLPMQVANSFFCVLFKINDVNSLEYKHVLEDYKPKKSGQKRKRDNDE